MAASPTIDGTASGTASSASTVTSTLTTTKTNDVVVVVVGYELSASQRNVSSVTASGLTFSLRGKYQPNPASQFHNSIEIWWAPSSGILTSEVITVTFDAAIDDCGMLAFGVNGAANISSPWDTNGALPAFHTASGSSDGPTISTSQADDLLLTALHNSTSTQHGNIPSSYSGVGSWTNSGGANFSEGNVASLGVTATQSSVQQLWSALVGGFVMWGDAITANAGSSTETGTVAFALSGVSFGVAGGREETATASLALNPVAFGAAASVIQESATVGLALAKVSIQAAVIDFAGGGVGSIHFSTFGA